MQRHELSFDVIARALSGPYGRIELGAILLCLALAWIVDRRLHWNTENLHGAARVGLASVNRVVFPLVALLLLVFAYALFRHWHTPFFLPLAIPLVISLAAIRIVVYVLRTLFAPGVGLTASERVLSIVIWIALILYYTGLLDDVQSALDEVKFVWGKHQFTLWQAGNALLLVGLTLFLSLWLSTLIEVRVMSVQRLDLNLRVLLAKFTRALLLLIGVLIALDATGIDITVLSVFGGALGVGIGLGLQKIASNYIAGFTILLDRSIRLGDMITVDSRYGAVTALTGRYVVVRSLDGIEAIVPNETLVTTTVLNHSRSSKEVRLALHFSVAYDTDLDLAMRLLIEAATKQARVLREPFAPQAYVAKFGDSGIELELGLWIKDPEEGRLNVSSDVNLAAWQAFNEHGVRMPYPQHEVRVLGEVGLRSSATNSEEVKRS
jgi:small-conductance mechanosensitive channel